MNQSAQSLSIISQHREKRVHIALPIRVSYWQNGVRSGVHQACTYDIGPTLARVTGIRETCNVGDIITVERGRNKALFRVCWVGDSDLLGQCGIECIDGEKIPWAIALQESEETYESVVVMSPPAQRMSGKNRRRVPRFLVEDALGFLKPGRGGSVEARIRNISESGCQLAVPSIVETGTDVELNLNVSDAPVTLRGKIRHVVEGVLSGVEFSGIRRGDRPLLQALLRKLQIDSRESNDWNFEIVKAST